MKAEWGKRFSIKLFRFGVKLWTVKFSLDKEEMKIKACQMDREKV